MEAFRKVYPSEFYKKFIVHGVRPDGRGLMKIRKTKVTTGSISPADGSSFVKMGQTSVCGGAVAEIGKPTDTSKNGQIVVNVELNPIASTRFRSGKPSEQAQVLGYFLNQTNLVSFEGLDIDTSEMNEEDDDEEDEQETDNNNKKKNESNSQAQFVWYIYVDLYCLNYSGNLLDTCLIALLAALRNVRIPRVKITKEGRILASQDQPRQLKINHYPIPITFGILDEYLLADPTNEEEELLSSSFTVIYNNKNQLCSIWKPGGTMVTEDRLKECIEITKQRVPKVIALLEQSDQLQQEEQ